MSGTAINSHTWTVHGQWRSRAEIESHFNLPAAQAFIDLLARRLVCTPGFDH